MHKDLPLSRMFFLFLLLSFVTTGFAAPAKTQDAQDDSLQHTVKGRFLLENYYGETVSDEDFRGKFELITFGYTFCPDVCPTTLTNMSGALKILGPLAKRIQPLFISVDPERDTPKVLRDYLKFFGQNIIGLTGSPELVKSAADNFHVTYQKVVDPEQDPRLYSMNHSAGIYLMSPDGVFLEKFAHILPPEALAKRLRAYLVPAN